jgi:ParB-like chromosome segregation protein Spo0J
MVRRDAPVQSNIPIHCAFDELADPAVLIPNPRNPNRHPTQQVELLAKIIRSQGWRAPITVSNRSGFVVRGHGRLEAALRLGTKEVPVDRQDCATEAEEWADLIADNRLSELADMDRKSLKQLVQELDTGEIDMDLTGFDAAALEELFAATTEAVNIDDLLTELDMAQAVENPIWIVIRTKTENQELVERVLAVLEQHGIRAERSYENG